LRLAKHAWYNSVWESDEMEKVNLFFL
jgi:hypothetical protein